MGGQGRIISASRRTDIPAFYAPWLMNRIRAGYCCYPNPVFPAKFYRVSLHTEDVSGFVFWTRHPAPLLPYLSELDKAGFTYYFQYTVTGYPQTIDGSSPPLETAIKTFLTLSQAIGANRVVWRYDPIILHTEITAEWHHNNFRRIADAIGSSAHHLVISVVDPYVKTQRRLGSSKDGVSYAIDAYSDLLHRIAAEAADRNLRVESCAEASLQIPGIVPGRCVDAHLLHGISGRASSHISHHNQREGCLCHRSVDIGVNNSCGFGCSYCYATVNHDTARETVNRHDSEWSCISKDPEVSQSIPE
ncbi:MAG: DUF1848 domain-containing protein [Desulfuromonadaceae bacterium]|nr:DUF1848 domain-containing protein [Desulfuromonadaceae bacterium]